MPGLGKLIRTNRLFGEDGRLVSVMFDHTIARGLMPELMAIETKIQAALNGQPDTITVHKGIADKVVINHMRPGVSLVIKATSPNPYDKSCAAVICDVESAIMRGADAIAVGCITGGANQQKNMEQAAALCNEADKWGLPVIGHFYPNGENIPRDKWEDWENVAYAARVGAEIGIDILKIHHSANVEELARIVEAVPAKVVLAGGSAGNKMRSYLQMARNAVTAGAAGVAFGRVVYNYKNPSAFVIALRMIVHENKSVDEALDYLSEDAGENIE